MRLEGPAPRDSREVGAPDGIPALLESTPAPTWAALLGAGGRFLRAGNGKDSNVAKRRFFCRWSDILVVGLDEYDVTVTSFKLGVFI